MYMQFIMLCGLSGSGKSSWAYHYTNSEPRPNKVNIISSDAIRGELYGDENIQRNPAKVFSLMLQRTKRALDKKESVIYDATNLNEKRRIALLNELSGYNCPKACVLFLNDPATCLKRQEMRERKVSAEVIWKQVKQFQPPHKSEGWNEIFIIKNEEGVSFNAMGLFNLARDFDQHNPHHSLNLEDHLYEAAMYAKENGMGDIVGNAALYHDIGKLMTQTFDDNKVAHYYSHENVSAYYYLLLNMEEFTEEDLWSFNAIEIDSKKEFRDSKLDTGWLIAHHMDFFKDEKYLEKLKKRVHPELWYKLVCLHECDLAAH